MYGIIDCDDQIVKEYAKAYECSPNIIVLIVISYTLGGAPHLDGQ